MRNIQRAFTLIELLVVIAIIAILAAILFPVFAAAKDSAKDTVALSGVKQQGLAVLMYATDNEDLFPLVAREDPVEGWWVWQETTQPYVKNWALYYHPKLPVPSGGQYYWQRLLHFGVPPRAEGVFPSDGSLSPHPSYWLWTDRFAGNKPVRISGLFGAGVSANDSWYNQYKNDGTPLSVPSLSQTAIVDPSTMWLTGEAGSWDMWWGVFGWTFGSCGMWLGTGWNVIDNNWSLFGPHSRKRFTDGRSGLNPSCMWANGMSIYVAADGSAKAPSYRGYIMNKTTDNLGDGTYGLKVVWPYN